MIAHIRCMGYGNVEIPTGGLNILKLRKGLLSGVHISGRRQVNHEPV